MADRHPGVGGLRLVLGGNPFGWTIDSDASFAVLDAFYERGGRSIDTAEGYSAWVPGNKGGESETIIGAWLHSRGIRADMKIATKTGMGGPPGALAPDKVAAACEGSLERLRTDWIDLYYIHRDDAVTPVDAVVSGYNALAAAGKVRELGASNISPQRLSAINAQAIAQGLLPFTVIQPGYNLIWRSEYPAALEQMAVRDGIAVLPFYGLASGFLTGKYAPEDDFAGMRGANAKMFATDAGWKALPVLRAVADQCGATMGQVALAWLAARQAIWAPIASASSAQQVHELCDAVTLQLDESQLARLTAISVDA